MTTKSSGAKGLKTEELVRAYFLRSGFFVMRGMKLRYDKHDLSDVDLWVYERSATFARRRTIIDIKDKKIPQAAERLFFIKGVASVIGVEGAGVATTDTRPLLRELARKHGVLWIDGADLQRLKDSSALAHLDRLTEEDFNSAVADVDSSRSSRNFRNRIDDVKSSVFDSFGAGCANTALEGFQVFAHESVNAHPNSAAAQVAGRLSYLSAAIAAAAFDFASADAALRPTPERIRFMTNAIRFGDNTEASLAKLRWTEAAIRDYLPNGVGLAQIFREKYWSDLQSVPAEGLSEIISKLSYSDKLFKIARFLEHSAYSIEPSSFDYLPTEIKGYIGALLDFCDVSRQKFAGAWSQEGTESGSMDRSPLSELSETPQDRTDDQSSAQQEGDAAPARSQGRLRLW